MLTSGAQAEELKVILNEQSGHNFSDTQMSGKTPPSSAFSSKRREHVAFALCLVLVLFSALVVVAPVLIRSVSSTGKHKKLNFDEFLELIAYTHKVVHLILA